MLEVRITVQPEGRTDIRAVFNPYGGLGLPKDLVVASMRRDAAGQGGLRVTAWDGREFVLRPRGGDHDTLGAAAEVFEILDLSQAQLAPNCNLWPERGQTVSVINDNSHPRPESFGNYRVELNHQPIGRIQEFDKSQGRFALLKQALNMAAALRGGLPAADSSNAGQRG